MIAAEKLFNTIQHNTTVRNSALLGCALWLCIAIALLGISSIDARLFFVYVAGTIGVLLSMRWPTVFLYAVAFFYPFLNLQIVFGPVNAPVVDILALMSCAGCVLRIFFSWVEDRQSLRTLEWWGLPLFCAWVAVGLLSTFFTEELLTSLYYVLRTLSFFYVAYVFVPLNTITTRQVMHRTLYSMVAVGAVVALYGLYGLAYSFIDPNIPRRVTPIDIFGFNPLGANHNLISEVMLATIPIALYLMVMEKQALRQKIMAVGIAGLIAAALLTFSRTAWLALGVELVVLVVAQYRKHITTFMKYGLLIGVLLLPVIVYMLYFSFASDVVESSNENRLLLNDVAVEMFTERPLVGAGPGTFTHRLGLNSVYTSEYGDPIDAHGFIQKVGSELGILGLLTYVGLICYALYTVVKAFFRVRPTEIQRYLMLAMVMMVCGSIFAQLFQTSYYSAKLWLPIGIALAASHLMTEQMDKKKQR